MKKLLAFISLIAYAMGLHRIKAHAASAIITKQAYINELINFEKSLLKQIKKLRNIGNQSLNKISFMQGSQFLERIILEQEVSLQREVLQEVQQESNHLVGLKSWACNNLTQEEMEQVKSQMSRIERIQQNISTRVQTLGSCHRDQELKYEVDNLKNSITRLKKQIRNVCALNTLVIPTVPSGSNKPDFPLLNISNLNSSNQNYIYSNLTGPFEYSKYLETLKLTYNITVCPQRLPFVVKGQCSTCQFYNLSSQECQKGCPVLTHFNLSTHQCADDIKIANLNESSGNWIYGQFTPEQYEEYLKGIQKWSPTLFCLKSAPFVGPNNTCIACNESDVYDLSAKECRNCPDTSKFSPASHECEEVKCVGDKMIWNGTGCVKCQLPGYFKGLTCICPDSYFYHWKKLQCRPRTEICTGNRYWNGSVCIKCDSPGTFIYANMTCLCPELYSYNSNSEKCLYGNGSVTKVANIFEAKNWVYGTEGKAGYEQALAKLNSITTTEECKAQSPYPNKDGKCVSCSIGQLYDLTTKLCKKCADKTTFNNVTHNCELDNSSIPVIQCPPEVPFWNGTGCVRCDTPGKFIDNICQCPTDFNYNWNLQKCKKVVIKYIPNFSSSQWTYGNITSKQYEDRLIKLADEYKLQKCPTEKPFPSNSGQCNNCSNDKIFDVVSGFCIVCPENQKLNTVSHYCEKFNVTEVVCPSEFPFYNGSVCIKCSKPGVFNIITLKCDCPSQYYYDAQTQNCTKISIINKNSNQNALNYYGERPTFNSLLGTCSEEIPFFNGDACVACNSPKFFDFLNLQCEACSQNMVFDISEHKCIVQQAQIKKYNSLLDSNNQNYCCNPPERVKDLPTCPKQFPYFNNIKCTACAFPKYFNFDKAKCLVCEPGQQFSIVTKICLQEKYLQTQYQSDLSYENYIGTPPKIDASYINVVKCPKANPFYNGKLCIQCQLPKYFDFNGLQCQTCHEGFEFSMEEKRCIEKKTALNYFNNYLVNVQNFVGQVPKYDPACTTCPKEKPFFDGKNCIFCEEPDYFNMTSKKCETCPSSTFFNIVNRYCQSSGQHFITNIKNGNIYYNGKFQEVIRYYQLKKRGNPSIVDCPEDKPFYQARFGKCIACPEDRPLFNIKYNTCTACTNGSYFNAERHICSSHGMVPASLERMLMNIRSHS